MFDIASTNYLGGFKSKLWKVFVGGGVGTV